MRPKGAPRWVVLVLKQMPRSVKWLTQRELQRMCWLSAKRKLALTATKKDPAQMHSSKLADPESRVRSKKARRKQSGRGILSRFSWVAAEPRSEKAGP